MRVLYRNTPSGPSQLVYVASPARPDREHTTQPDVDGSPAAALLDPGQLPPEVRAEYEHFLMGVSVELYRNDRRRRPLLDPCEPTPEIRAVCDEPERPGTWLERCDLLDPAQGGDGRRLTQEQTDVLIVSELDRIVLLRSFAELQEFTAIVAPWWRPKVPPQDLPPRARSQCGGIHSDPLVRYLAWRAWGDRDRRWFVDRGIRQGDPLALLPDGRVALAWSGEPVVAHAARAQRSGGYIDLRWSSLFEQRRSIDWYDMAGVRVATFQVSDRLRVEPPR